MNTFSTWLTAFMLALFATAVGLATQFPAGARFMPYVVGFPGIGLCLLQLLLDAMRAPGSRLATYRFRSAPKLGRPIPGAAGVMPEEAEFGPHTVRSELTMLAYFVAFILAVLVFGFYPTIPVMVVAFLRREAKASWRLALSLGIGGTLVVYLMFAEVLQMRLHPGFVTPWVLSFFRF